MSSVCYERGVVSNRFCKILQSLIRTSLGTEIRCFLYFPRKQRKYRAASRVVVRASLLHTI